MRLLRTYGSYKFFTIALLLCAVGYGVVGVETAIKSSNLTAHALRVPMTKTGECEWQFALKRQVQVVALKGCPATASHAYYKKGEGVWTENDYRNMLKQWGLLTSGTFALAALLLLWGAGRIRRLEVWPFEDEVEELTSDD